MKLRTEFNLITASSSVRWSVITVNDLNKPTFFSFFSFRISFVSPSSSSKIILNHCRPNWQKIITLKYHKLIPSCFVLMNMHPLHHPRNGRSLELNILAALIIPSPITDYKEPYGHENIAIIFAPIFAYLSAFLSLI